MRHNVLAEITEPLAEPRCTNVPNPYFFTRHSSTKRIKIVPRAKQYKLVFDKRVVDPNTFMTFPYGYKPYLDDQDIENINTLLDL